MEPQREKRRLTTILAADVVGYSRLMGTDEAGTLAALKMHRKELIEPKTEQYNGRTVKLMGDGALMEFGSVVDAVRFAVEVQSEMAKRNDGVPDDCRIEYRIGINIGDIIADGDDIYGDGVNIASRLESLADAGGICLSGAAFQQVRKKLDLAFEPMGEQRVKNIAELIEVWRIASNGAPNRQLPRRRTAQIASMAVAALAILTAVAIVIWDGLAIGDSKVVTQDILSDPSGPKVTVLPFESINQDQDDVVFAAGMTEEIIAALTSFYELHVVARGVAEESDIAGANAFMLTGTVRRASDTFRITARLISADDGRQVWAGTYDRPLNPSEILTVQRDVAAKIVSSIASSWGGAIAAGQLRGSLDTIPSQLSSYECVSTALAYFHNDPTLYATARDCLVDTVAAEPNYADAWAMLAEIYGRQWYGHEPLIPGEIYDPLERSMEAAKRALALEPNSARSHYAYAMALDMAGDMDGFYAEARRALELNPNEPIYLGSLGTWIAFTGRWDEGLELIEKAKRLNPNAFAPWWNYAPAMVALQNRDYETAIARFKQSYTGWWINYMHQAYTYGLMGDEENAALAVERLLELQPGYTMEDALEFHRKYQFEPGFTELAMEGLRLAGLPSAETAQRGQ